jgi:hypothetical protein
MRHCADPKGIAQNPGLLKGHSSFHSFAKWSSLGNESVLPDPELCAKSDEPSFGTINAFSQQCRKMIIRVNEDNLQEFWIGPLWHLARGNAVTTGVSTAA